MITRRRAVSLLAAAGASPAFVTSARATVAPPRGEIRPGLLKYFSDIGTIGTFVAYKADEYLVIASDTERSGEPLLPACTFKIPDSLIALATGVVSDPDKDIFKWDGVERYNTLWNCDHTLRSAMATSASPVYQELARRIGPGRMQRYLVEFEYGNRNISGGIDQFWMCGGLRVDPIQQIDFLDRLCRGVLPVPQRCQELVRDILPVTTMDGSIIRARTGLVGVEIGAPSLGWVVGWVQSTRGRTVFALNCDIRERSHIRSLMTLAQLCLTDIEAL